ncbi:MAG: MarR family winged helix-turn-helix transcriptional regulator [Actinomycetales bacterium]
MSQVEWLDDREQAVWRLYLEVSQRLWSRLTRELGDETGVSIAEYDVLVKLSEAPDRTLRMSELASRTTQSRSRVTHTVARMETAGHVARQASADDGRGVTATLTDAGFALLESAAPSHVGSVREHFISHLPNESLVQVEEVLAKMAQHLRALDPNHAPFAPGSQE